MSAAIPIFWLRLKVAVLSQPLWLTASAPLPGLKRTNEYPPKTSILDELWAKTERLITSTNKLANKIFRMDLISSVTNKKFPVLAGLSGLTPRNNMPSGGKGKRVL